MLLTKADGAPWRIDDAPTKLALRSQLPGARVFDLAADSLRKARAAGVPVPDRLILALPASWCVNSPAPSTVLRRWALSPHRDVWVSLVEVLEEPRTGRFDPETSAALLSGLGALGTEPFLIEAVSKVLALLVPDAVPLMPAPARAFVLGEAAAQGPQALVAMIDWFASAAKEGEDELAALALSHGEVPLSGPQVLDRLLWFDSEGHRHFPPL